MSLLRTNVPSNHPGGIPVNDGPAYDPSAGQGPAAPVLNTNQVYQALSRTLLVATAYLPPSSEIWAQIGESSGSLNPVAEADNESTSTISIPIALIIPAGWYYSLVSGGTAGSRITYAAAYAL